MSTPTRNPDAGAILPHADRPWLDCARRARRIPRFVTFETENGFRRLPVEHATVSQLRQMVKLRADQIEADRRALDALAGFLSEAEAGGAPAGSRGAG